jgi:hypothetical protein
VSADHSLQRSVSFGSGRDLLAVLDRSDVRPICRALKWLSDGDLTDASWTIAMDSNERISCDARDKPLETFGQMMVDSRPSTIEAADVM